MPRGTAYRVEFVRTVISNDRAWAPAPKTRGRKREAHARARGGVDVTLAGRTVRVGKILCVGRNYLDHAREMGSTASREELARQPPFFFLKPASALVASGGEIVLPREVGDVHFEAEMAVLVGTRARRVDRSRALDHVGGYAAFLDVTARDLQASAKKAGLPWTLAKGMDTFAPCGDFAPATSRAEPDVEVTCHVNGALRQRGRTGDMIHGVASLLAHASRHVTLHPGDVLATGTPAGVGPLADGDRVRVVVGGLPPLSVTARLEAA